jgi:hypothetical protein
MTELGMERQTETDRKKAYGAVKRHSSGVCVIETAQKRK